jgi:dihydroxy-acid dehydratase
MITIDADKKDVSVALSAEELAKRKAAWKPRLAQYQSGAIWRYGETVSSARTGAVTHPGPARQKAAAE